MAFTFYASAQSLPERTPELEKLLAQVDSELDRSDHYNRQKEDRISLLKKQLGNASNPEQRYWAARDIYGEYSTFNSDSAMAYADYCLSLARMLGRREWIDEMNLNRSYVFSATGLLEQAVEALSEINPDSLNTTMTISYCERLLFLGTRRFQYIGDEHIDEAYPPEIDSMLQSACIELSPGDEQYSWFRGWSHLKDKSSALEVIPEVKRDVDAQALDNRNAAMDAWVLSKLYEYAGQPDLRLEYLLRSAIADIKCSNKEIASLEEAAWILFQMGDIDHARAYIDYSIRCANDYKSRVRLSRLAFQQEQVLGALHARNELESRQNGRWLAVLCPVLAILLLALIFIVRQMRQLSRSQAALHSANVELNERIEELQQTRSELAKANDDLQRLYAEARRQARELADINESKEKYIANIFALCSNYINKLDDFRKNIYRLIVARRFDDVSTLTKSQDLPLSEIKELYANFDSIFLQIYPDFVADFNTLLRPDERITLKSGEKLNTELRIYALVRLGLNDSVKIAQFLHCSVQTVYNTRQRARNKAIVPKDEFAQAVRALGKSAF